MIAVVQEKAAMPLDISSTPLKRYNNQWENINKKLTRQKEAIERNDKSKVNKVTVYEDVWEQVDRHQQEELQLAICGLRKEYELADVLAHLAVSGKQLFHIKKKSTSRLRCYTNMLFSVVCRLAENYCFLGSLNK